MSHELKTAWIRSMVNKERLQTIIDTLEANGSIEALVQHFDERASWHKKQVMDAQRAIETHTAHKELHQSRQDENEALAQAFRTLKEE